MEDYEHHPRKVNAEKENARAIECKEKEGFTKNGISKFIEFWKTWLKTQDTAKRWLDLLGTGSVLTKR